MQTTLMGRKTVLSVFTLAVIFSTTFVFHSTQSFYKNFMQGSELFDKGRYYDAIPFLITASRIERDNMKAQALLLWSYDRLGMKKEAKEVLESMWATYPDDVRVMENLADVCYSLGYYDRSEELYRKVVSMGGGTPDVEKKFAEVLTWQKKYGEAIPIFEGIVRRHPDNLEIKQLLADIYSWSKSYDKAINIYRELISDNYRTEDNILKLADVLRYAGRNEDAITLYEEYLKNKN